MKRITVLVSGKVQEVGYRERVVTIAKKFMLTGMVQNLEDGRVKIVAEGEEDKLKSFIDAIHIKNTMILVENMEIIHSDATKDYADFYKLVGVGETDSRLDTATDHLKRLIEVVSNGFNGMNSKMDIMIEKQDIMIEKQNETIFTIQNESELTRKELGSKIDLFNMDSRDHAELNYKNIKEEIKNIKISLKK